MQTCSKKPTSLRECLYSHIGCLRGCQVTDVTACITCALAGWHVSCEACNPARRPAHWQAILSTYSMLLHAVTKSDRLTDDCPICQSMCLTKWHAWPPRGAHTHHTWWLNDHLAILWLLIAYTIRRPPFGLIFYWNPLSPSVFLTISHILFILLKYWELIEE